MALFYVKIKNIMAEQKKSFSIGVTIVALVIVISLFFLLNDSSKMNMDDNMENTNNSSSVENTDNLQNNQQFAELYKCGLTVSYPTQNSQISLPLSVSGSIDNLNANDNCTWTMFEGMGGTVTISNGNNILASVGLPILGDWTGNLPVTFSAILNPPGNFPSGTVLNLTFQESNPSGEGVPDSLVYQVVVQ